MEFQYSYSAAQSREAQIIRDKYLLREECALDELKRLDRLVDNAGVVPALIIGVLSCLMFGLGMSFALGALPKNMLLGGLFGAIGSAGMLSAHPVYRKFYNKARAQHQSRILELAAQLCGETNE